MSPHASSPSRLPLSLSVRQRDLIVELGLAPSEILARIRFAVPLGDSVVLDFSVDELKVLGVAVFEVVRQAESKSLQDELSDICRDIAVVLEPYLGPAHEALTSVLDSLPPPLRDDVVNLMAEGEFDNPEELLDAIEQLTLKYTRESYALPDGLSVPEFNTLVSCDWDADSPGLCLNPNLPLADLKDAPFPLNARIFLQAMADAGPGGVRATARGNLNRKFVSAMFDTMHWPPEYAEGVRYVCKVINEADIRDLGLIRFLAETARLIRKSKGTFHITKKGRAMLGDEAAGTLYARLFRAFFQEYDLSTEWFGPECPLLQDTIAYSLFMMSRHAAEWQPQREIIEVVVLGGVTEEYLRHGGSPEFEEFCRVVHQRFFRPLAGFGLVEFDHDPSDVFGVSPATGMRKTGLFDAFLTFNLPDTDSQEPPQ